nr:ATP-binding protein [Nitrosomonas nitrosa]
MSTPRILVVEDESIVALDLQSRLIRLGYQVVGIANSGDAAIQMVAENCPNLALMDIRLRGGMDGVDTAGQLRERFGVPVIYLTAYADEPTLERAKITEPLGYLLKPFEERELHSTIEMALYRIEMDKRLQTETARLQRILSTVPEGIMLLDANHRVVLANAKAQDYLGYLAGKNAGDIVSHLGTISLDQLLSQPDDLVWHEIPLAGSQQTIFEVNVSSVHPDPDSVMTGLTDPEWLLVIRDVTIERETQQRIRLQERQAAVGQFAAGISHDFNNILAGILMNSYLTHKNAPDLPPVARERLNTIDTLVLRARDLIAQLVDFSRSAEVEMFPFSLVPMLKEQVKMIQRMLPASIRVNLIYPEFDCLMYGDATRIMQLIMNLAVNARDAMPNGGELRIELAEVTRTGDRSNEATDNNDDRKWVNLIVSDCGMGIEPEILPYIFEPFFTTKGPNKGSGLGLAQVYGIVEEHNGHIEVQSQVGKGTVFTIYLPVIASDYSVE